jgi:hypothetical protein
MAVHLPMAPNASDTSSSSSIWAGVAPGVTAGDLAGDAWWQCVPAEWRRKASSRGQQDYLFTPAAEELQPGHERYTLATALWWYRSLQGEPIVVRGARVSGHPGLLVDCGTFVWWWWHTERGGMSPGCPHQISMVSVCGL